MDRIANKELIYEINGSSDISDGEGESTLRLGILSNRQESLLERPLGGVIEGRNARGRPKMDYMDSW